MRSAASILALLVWTTALVANSPAQPILNRVEQFLRDQIGEAGAPAPTAGKTNEPGYLGVTADDREVAPRGVRIVSVAAGSPASQAGLLAGDLITAIDGRPIRSMDDMAQALDGKSPGAKSMFTVNRVGAERQAEVTLGRRPQSRLIGNAPQELPPPPGPSDAVAAPRGPRLGVRTLPVSEETRLRNNLPDARGAAVIAVTAGSPAERAGIPLGAVITAVDNQPVETPQALASAVSKAGDAVELTYVDRGLQNRRRVTLGAGAVATQPPSLELRGRPVDPPTAPQPAEHPTPAAPTLETSTVKTLEARIKELEARIEKLEAALEQKPNESK